MKKIALVLLVLCAKGYALDANHEHEESPKTFHFGPVPGEHHGGEEHTKEDAKK